MQIVRLAGFTVAALAAIGVFIFVGADDVERVRPPEIEGIDHEKVLSYVDVLLGGCNVGKRVALIGAGGIGFDVAEFLTHEGKSTAVDRDAFLREWGVVDPDEARGGVSPGGPKPAPSPRTVFLLQRKSGKPGAGLGKTTGWIHRISLKMKNVRMIPGVNYERIDDRGLHITLKERPELLEVDNIVICAGQKPRRDLHEALLTGGATVHVIGGADVAAELDAKRAIKQASLLASRL